MKRLQKILLSPWVIILATALSIYTAIFHKEFALSLKPAGELYLTLLQMCVVPILMTAIISSLGRFLKDGSASRFLGQFVALAVFSLVTVAMVGAILGLAGGVGQDLSIEARTAISNLIEASGYKESTSTQSPSLFSFLHQMIPANVFAAVSAGNNLQILFFSIFIGVALGLIKSKESDLAIGLMDSFYNAFLKLMTWFMIPIPFGLYFIFSSQFAHTGVEIFLALFKFILVTAGASIVLMIAFLSFISIMTKKSLFTVTLAMKDAIIVAMGTQSSFAAMPQTLKCLQENLGLDHDITDLIVPIATSLNPIGNVLLFSLTTVFMAQLYNIPLDAQAKAIIILGSVLTSIAASGAPGVAALSMMSIALAPLGLPVTPAIVVLLAVLPFIEPVGTAANVLGNAATATFIALNSKNSAKETEFAEAVAVETEQQSSQAKVIT